MGASPSVPYLIVLLFLSLVDDDERDLSNYMLTLYLFNFPTHQPLLLRRDEFGVGLWVPSTLKPT